MKGLMLSLILLLVGSPGLADPVNDMQAWLDSPEKIKYALDYGDKKGQYIEMRDELVKLKPSIKPVVDKYELDHLRTAQENYNDWARRSPADFGSEDRWKLTECAALADLAHWYEARAQYGRAIWAWSMIVQTMSAGYESVNPACANIQAKVNELSKKLGEQNRAANTVGVPH